MRSRIWNSHLERGQIRLLHIQPAADPADIIECQLEILPLNPVPVRFAAISYTWGGEQTSAYVRCNNARYAVTPSCDGALRAYRRLGGTVAWIDQLCVDQENLDERATQVTLMGQIYSQAEHVYIWLGEFGSPSQPGSLSHHLKHLTSSGLITQLRSVVDSASQLPSSSLKNYESVHFIVDNLLNIDKPNEKDLKQLETTGDNYHLVLNILQRPYHARRWIIQEISLNQNVDILLGDLCFPFEFIVRAALVMRPFFSEIDHKPSRQKLATLLGKTLTDRFYLEMIPWLHLTNIDMIRRIRNS